MRGVKELVQEWHDLDWDVYVCHGCLMCCNVYAAQSYITPFVCSKCNEKLRFYPVGFDGYLTRWDSERFTVACRA